MSSIGRNFHPYWKEGQFEAIYEKVPLKDNPSLIEVKLKALCPKCNKKLGNTAEKRLKSHRNVCKLDGISNQSTTCVNSFQSNVDDSSRDETANSESVDFSSEVEKDNMHNALVESSMIGGKRKDRSLSSEFQEVISDTNAVQQPTNSTQWNVESSRVEKVVHQSKKKATNMMKKFLDTIDDKSILKVHDNLLKFLISVGIDFDAIDSVYFYEFCKSLRPAYEPILSSELLHDTLPRVYNEMMKKNHRIKSSGILLFCVQKTSDIISMTYDNEGRHFFVGSDLSINFDNFVKESVEKVDSNFNSTVYAIVSNTDQTLCLEDSNRDFWYLPCISKSVVKIIDLILDDELKQTVTSIINEFFNYDKELELLRRGGLKMSNFSTCINENIHEVLIPVCKNLRLMREIVTETELVVDKEVLVILIEKKFETDLKVIIDILNELIEISHLKKDLEYSIADAIEDIIKIAIKIESLGLRNTSAIKDVIKTSCNPVSMTANYLHPTYKGKNLQMIVPDSETVIQKFFIVNTEENVMSTFLKFKAKSDIFSVLLKKKYENPITFYLTLQTFHPEFAEFCLKLIKIPAYTNHKNLNFNLQKNLDFQQEKEITELFYLLKCNEKKREKKMLS